MPERIMEIAVMQESLFSCSHKGEVDKVLKNRVGAGQRVNAAKSLNTTAKYLLMYPASQTKVQLQKIEQPLSLTALVTLQPTQPASMTIGSKLMREKTDSVLTIDEDSDEELTTLESGTVSAKTFHQKLLTGALIVTITIASIVSNPGRILHTKGEDAATALLEHNLVYHIYLVSFGLALFTSLILVILSIVDKDPNSTRLSKALWTSLVGMVLLFTVIAFMAFVGSASFLARAFL